MLFSNSAKDTNPPNLNISNKIIQNTKCTKFVGWHIDENLKWDTHIKFVQARISDSFYAINKINNFIFMSKAILICIKCIWSVHEIVQSLINYLSNIFDMVGNIDMGR